MSGVLEDFDENDSEQADMSEIGIRKLRALARGQEYPISEHDQEHAAGLSPPVLDKVEVSDVPASVEAPRAPKVKAVFKDEVPYGPLGMTKFLEGSLKPAQKEPDVIIRDNRMLTRAQYKQALDGFLSSALDDLAHHVKPVPVYNVGNEIDSGEFGTVYEATAPGGEPVVVKRFHDSSARNETAALEALVAINHKNLVRVRDVVREYDHIVGIVMDKVEGCTLREVLADGRMNYTTFIGVASQLLDAVDYLHTKNVYHGDIKPENVKIRSDGTLVLLDFGLARVLRPGVESSVGTKQATTVGTARYMAPEQLSGRIPEPTEVSDISSTAKVLYEMLNGRVPESADDVDADVFAEYPGAFMPRMLTEVSRALARQAFMKPNDRGDADDLLYNCEGDTPIPGEDPAFVIYGEKSYTDEENHYLTEIAEESPDVFQNLFAHSFKVLLAEVGHGILPEHFTSYAQSMLRLRKPDEVQGRTIQYAYDTVYGLVRDARLPSIFALAQHDVAQSLEEYVSSSVLEHSETRIFRTIKRATTMLRTAVAVRALEEAADVNLEQTKGGLSTNQLCAIASGMFAVGSLGEYALGSPVLAALSGSISIFSGVIASRDAAYSLYTRFRSDK